MNSSRTAQLTFSFGGFLGQNVSLKRLTAFDGATAPLRKALGSTFLGFHLRHEKNPIDVLSQVVNRPSINASRPDNTTVFQPLCLTELGVKTLGFEIAIAGKSLIID